MLRQIEDLKPICEDAQKEARRQAFEEALEIVNSELDNYVRGNDSDADLHAGSIGQLLISKLQEKIEELEQ